MSDIEYSKLDDDLLLTTEQLAKWWGVSASYLNKGRTYGTGPKFIKMGKAVRYRVGDARQWMSEQASNRVRKGLIVSTNPTLPLALSPDEIESILDQHS